MFGVEFNQLISRETVVSLFHAALLVVLGIPVILLISKWVRQEVAKKWTAQRGMILGKIILYIGLALIFMSVLHEFGFHLGPLLGAAGIIGIAVGFASQTSVSNVISGVFLMTEQSFVVGDAIQVGTTVGQVLSIDMLSVKLRTFDNRFVRIPNETLLKSEVINMSRFPIRRLDLNISIAYREDVGRVREVLFDVIHTQAGCLQEPEPLIVFTGFGASSIDLLVAVWVVRDDFLRMKNQLQEAIKSRFDAENIEIPFPHVSVYSGSMSEPFPVRVVGSSETIDKSSTGVGIEY